MNPDISQSNGTNGNLYGTVMYDQKKKNFLPIQ